MACHDSQPHEVGTFRHPQLHHLNRSHLLNPRPRLRPRHPLPHRLIFSDADAIAMVPLGRNHGMPGQAPTALSSHLDLPCYICSMRPYSPWWAGNGSGTP